MKKQAVQEMAELELIVRYEGELGGRAELEEVQVTKLLGGYALWKAEEEVLAGALQCPCIIYAELPSRVFFAVEQAKQASCISGGASAGAGGGALLGAEGLTGRGVLVAVIDSGIDYAHPDFCNEDGTTRIAALWDQTVSSGTPPEGYHTGSLYTRQDIDRALSERREENRRAVVPSVDLSGHGTHVAGIAAGNGRASGGRNRGVAYESELLIVKLAAGNISDAYGTARLMEAADFCLRFAMAENRPIAINLSFGNNYGAHNGQSLLETYLDSVVPLARCALCIGTGNEGNGRKHAGGRIRGTEEVELSVSGRESSLYLQLWKNYTDRFSLEIVSPSGRRDRFTYEEGEAVRGFGSGLLFTGRGRTVRTGGVTLEVLWSLPTPYQSLSVVQIGLIGEQGELSQGVWTFRFVPEKIFLGTYDLWILQGTESSQSGFVRPVSERTLTIPSTAGRCIAVGAYDTAGEKIAVFSGRGYPRGTGRIKPDLVAPGVNITSCAPGGGYAVRTGTSMATPFVTGSAALLMEWGIVRGNDRYLYGEKLTEYLRRGARQLPGLAGGAEVSVYGAEGEEGNRSTGAQTAASGFPNRNAGFGALCVRDSLPG